MAQPIVILAHNIRSLWNIGSLFRCSDAFGISHIYLTGYSGTPPRKEISKTAIGADEWIPWTYEKDPHTVIQKLRTEGYAIIALEKTDKSVDIAQFSEKKPLCLILGHEVLGVSDDLIGEADAVVHIPMKGKKSSVNVVIAAAIAMHTLS